MRACLIALALFAFSAPAWAGWKETLPEAKPCGQGEFRMFGFDVYTAKLWGNCTPTPFDAPFALQLTYRRTIARSKIVESSLDEIKRMAVSPISAQTLVHWRRLMETAFVNVISGDQIVGVYLPRTGTRFYVNNTLTAQISDEQFAHAFFDIWLAPNTRAPGLRTELLGPQP